MKLGRKFEHHQPAPSADVPDTVDWREKGYVTGVKDQVLFVTRWSGGMVWTIFGTQSIILCVAEGWLNPSMSLSAR